MFTCLRKNPKTLKMEMGILSVNHLIRASIRRVYVEGVLLFVRLKSVDRSLLILPVKATHSSTELSFADALLHRSDFRQ